MVREPSCVDCQFQNVSFGSVRQVRILALVTRIALIWCALLVAIPLFFKAQKVWIALEVANAPYEMEEIALYGEGGKPEWFLELNPNGTVPVLVIFGGARILKDSDLILDEFHKVGNGASLVPSGRKAASKATGFRALLSEFLPLGKAAVLGGHKAKMWSKLKELDSNIEGPYICGEQVTIADCAAFPFLWRIDSEFGPVEKEGCNNIRAWLDHCQKNPGFAKTIQGTWWWWW
jgi:glutathione S-transferase